MARPERPGLKQWSAVVLALLLSGCTDVAGPAAHTLAPTAPSSHITSGLSDGTARIVETIFLGAAHGDSIVRLTTGSSPAWSPDGKQVAFVRGGSIYLVQVDGQNEVVLGAGSSPAWSPDGKQIAFVSAFGIEVMNADGSNVRALLPHLFRTDTYADWDMGVGEPTWSPDGGLIAFQHQGDGDTQPGQIYIMNTDGSDPRRLSQSTRVRYAESDPSWAPDSKRIVFWSYGFGINWSNVDDGLSVSLWSNFPHIAYGARPAWSPDGQRIAFNSFAWLPGAPPNIYVMPLTRESLTLLFENAHSASWSPDGSRIAFVRSGTSNRGNLIGKAR